jgi:hypothetical protein
MVGKLGTIFARAGHNVVFSYSRSQRKLERLASEEDEGSELAYRFERFGGQA